MAIHKSLQSADSNRINEEGISDLFIPTEPTPQEDAVLRHIRHVIESAASEVNTNIVDSREKSLALTKLEEAMMWASKAVLA